MDTDPRSPSDEEETEVDVGTSNGDSDQSESIEESSSSKETKEVRSSRLRMSIQKTEKPSSNGLLGVKKHWLDCTKMQRMMVCGMDQKISTHKRMCGEELP